VTRPPRILQANRVEAHASFRTTQHSRPVPTHFSAPSPSPAARAHTSFLTTPSRSISQSKPGQAAIRFNLWVGLGWRFFPRLHPQSSPSPHPNDLNSLPPAWPLALRAPIGHHPHPRRTRLTRSSTPTDPPRALDIPVPYLALLRYVRSFDSPPFLPNHVRLRLDCLCLFYLRSGLAQGMLLTAIRYTCARSPVCQ
jgi:hypothetical protein